MLLNTTLYMQDAYSPPRTLYDFFSGLLCFAIITAPFWYGFRQQLLRYSCKDEEESSNSDEEDDSSEEEDKDDYSMNYMTEFVLLADRALTNEDLELLNDKSVKETIDFGDVILTYNRDTESFWYYTDHLKEVSYILLEAIARKFVIEHDCKRLYLGGGKPPGPPLEENLSTVSEEKAEKSQEVDSNIKGGVQGGAAPFAKFKKYNTGSKTSSSTGNKSAITNFKTGIDVIEQPNHFRYKGKLYEYEEGLKATERALSDAAVPTMTYAAFKQLLEDKKEK